MAQRRWSEEDTSQREVELVRIVVVVCLELAFVDLEVSDGIKFHPDPPARHEVRQHQWWTVDCSASFL